MTKQHESKEIQLTNDSTGKRKEYVIFHCHVENTVHTVSVFIFVGIYILKIKSTLCQVDELFIEPDSSYFNNTEIVSLKVLEYDSFSCMYIITIYTG